MIVWLIDSMNRSILLPHPKKNSIFALWIVMFNFSWTRHIRPLQPEPLRQWRHSHWGRRWLRLFLPPWIPGRPVRGVQAGMCHQPGLSDGHGLPKLPLLRPLSRCVWPQCCVWGQAPFPRLFLPTWIHRQRSGGVCPTAEARTRGCWPLPAQSLRC